MKTEISNGVIKTLRWTPVSNKRHDQFADFKNELGFGRMVVFRVPRRRKNAFGAKFHGELKTGPKTITTERRQNFIATIEDAKAICERWLNGENSSSCLLKINEDRERNA